ncbi:major facilitator superfamily domain-containing protein [Melanogaster broomeanus]|nr:major facilitator superfamily domain-containing protein [Melanogaster broomeanus]
MTNRLVFGKGLLSSLALELVGQSGLGHSFDSFQGTNANPYSKAIKNLLHNGKTPIKIFEAKKKALFMGDEAVLQQTPGLCSNGHDTGVLSRVLLTLAQHPEAKDRLWEELKQAKADKGDLGHCYALEWKPDRWLKRLPSSVAEAHIPGVKSHLFSELEMTNRPSQPERPSPLPGASVGSQEPDSESDAHALVLLDPHTEEKRLLRKLDRRILPITCLLYLFAYIDRSNLGNARLQGLPQDVLGGDPTGVLFDWLVAAFYIPYASNQAIAEFDLMPSAMDCTFKSTANNFSSLLVARLGLGVFEAAFGPVVVLYFSFYYTKAEYGVRVAYWFGFAAVAGAFSGLIAYAIEHVEVSIAGWRLLFIIEADQNQPNISLPAERKLAVERMNRGTSGDLGAVVNHSHVIAAFLDWRASSQVICDRVLEAYHESQVYVAGIMYFGLNCALGSLSAFLPTIIETMGYSSVLSQLMSVPPYAVAGTILLIAAYTSDKIQSRGLMVVAGCTLGGIGYMILLGVTHHQHVRYFATFCIATGTYASLGLILAWCKDVFALLLHLQISSLQCVMKSRTIWDLKRNVLRVCRSLEQSDRLGVYLGSHLYPLTEGPAYSCVPPTIFRLLSADNPKTEEGLEVLSGALMFLAAISALVLSISYRLDNRRRNEEFGEPDLDERVDTSELADKAPGFRYIP